MPSYKIGPYRQTNQSIAQSAIGMIRNYGADAWAEANRIAVRFAKVSDEEGEKTWRAIGRAIDKQLLVTVPATQRLEAVSRERTSAGVVDSPCP